MRRFAPLLMAAAALVAVVALFFALRPEDATVSEPEPSSATGTATTETGTETTQEAATTTGSAVTTRRISVAVRNERVRGGVRRIAIERGERVEVVVSSDAADEVHVHGYDLLAHVGPAKPARLVFRARIPGRFEIELEDSHLLLAELRVGP